MNSSPNTTASSYVETTSGFEYASDKPNSEVAPVNQEVHVTLEKDQVAKTRGSFAVKAQVFVDGIKGTKSSAMDVAQNVKANLVNHKYRLFEKQETVKENEKLEQQTGIETERAEDQIELTKTGQNRKTRALKDFENEIAEADETIENNQLLDEYKRLDLQTEEIKSIEQEIREIDEEIRLIRLNASSLDPEVESKAYDKNIKRYAPDMAEKKEEIEKREKKEKEIFRQEALTDVHIEMVEELKKRIQSKLESEGAKETDIATAIERVEEMNIDEIDIENAEMDVEDEGLYKHLNESVEINITKAEKKELFDNMFIVRTGETRDELIRRKEVERKKIIKDIVEQRKSKLIKKRQTEREAIIQKIIEQKMKRLAKIQIAKKDIKDQHGGVITPKTRKGHRAARLDEERAHRIKYPVAKEIYKIKSIYKDIDVVEVDENGKRITFVDRINKSGRTSADKKRAIKAYRKYQKLKRETEVFKYQIKKEWPKASTDERGNKVDNSEGGGNIHLSWLLSKRKRLEEKLKIPILNS